MVGKTVQQYVFLEKLGAGGMGEIYRAQDTRLNRFVAIKVLVGASALEPERRRRFIQEAQAASALNHPNIITIHDIISDTSSDVVAEHMVMEHIQGKTLGDLIPKGGLRVPQLLKIGLQMTDALTAAHNAGIIHRDLKPGNVMVTESGLVKVLDFGLAKLTDNSPITGTGSEDVTRTIAERPLTVEGSIIGTVSYMSPEQAQGRKVDARSDVFSMGAVLYEMATGERAFRGETTLETLSAILRDDPKPIVEIAPDVPAALEQLISRCLRKLPDDRFQNMREVYTALSALKYESDSGVLYRSVMLSSTSQTSAVAPPKSAVVAPPRSNMQAWAGGLIALVAVSGGLYWFLIRPGDSLRQTQAETATVPPPPAIATPANETLTNDNIVEMWTAKLPLTIFGQMRADKTAFNMSPSEVIRLTKAHLPPQLIEAMRDPKNAPVLPVTPPVDATELAGKGAADGQLPGDLSKAFGKGPDKIGPGGQQVALLNGSPFAIVLAADIPDDAEQGRSIHFTVKNDVKVGESIVIAKGAMVVGEIVQGAKKRLFGGARMTMKLLTVDAVDGRKYSVRALASRGGDGKAERRVETNAKPQGENLAASAGMDYLAYADGDLLISVRK